MSQMSSFVCLLQNSRVCVDVVAEFKLYPAFATRLGIQDRATCEDTKVNFANLCQKPGNILSI